MCGSYYILPEIVPSSAGAPPFSLLFGERVGSEEPILIHGVWRDIADIHSIAG
jgi:hypothetical protein